MFKFLRKYNKWILAVGGTLLLVVFLIPQAITGLSRRAALAGATWATMGPDGEIEVSVTEQDVAQRELRLIESTGLRNVFDASLGLQQPEHWYLLAREAEQAGLVAGPGTITQAEQVLNLQGAESSGFTRTTLAKVDGVLRLLSAYRTAGQLSDERLRTHAARAMFSATAEIVPIEASAEKAEGPEPTEEALLEQFDAYANVNPGEGDMGFGYRFPNRFKIEWLTLTRDAVREQIEQGEHMSELELRKHWRRNQLEEGIPAIEPGAPVPDAVRESLLENLTDEEMRQIEKDCTDELRMRRRGLESDQGYITLPEDWPDQRLSLEALAQTIQQAHGVTLPTYQAIGDRWLSLDDLADVPELAGVTTTRFGPTPVALSTVIQALREFEGSTSILVQEGVAFPPFQDPDGSLLIIRVTATDAARPPASLDEVRDRVARDLRRRAHYEALVASIDQIEADARSEGLLAMAMRYDTPVARSNVELYNRQFLDFYLNQQRTPQMFPSSLPVVGPDEDTIRTILDRCLDLPQDVPVTDLPVEQRIFAVPVERSLTVLLVKIRETRPLTTDLYQRLVEANAIHAIVLSEELDATEQAFDAFRYEALAARHHFALSTRQPDEDATASAPEEAPEPGGS